MVFDLGQQYKYYDEIQQNDAGSQQEINDAYAELRSGSFYKKKARGDWRAMAERSDVPYTTEKVLLDNQAASSRRQLPQGGGA